jgi:chemotaxis protein histidine kinase CheA
VLPYQGHVVRLLDLEHLLVPQERPHSQVYDHQMDIVMCWHGQALVGLVVQHIVGMADVPRQLHQADTHQFGLQGMVLHQGEVINVLHLPQLLHGTPEQSFPVETMED